MAILGIDEVGRGPLAGPLVVGAVILPDEKPEWVDDLRDSKKLSAKKREALSAVIRAEVPYGLGFVPAEELDAVGISEALRLATRRAVKAVQELHVPFSQIIIDGKVNFLAGTPLEKYVSTAVKADDLIKEVSAASIVAKVARDNYMVELSKKYPEYGFDKHVGYGTAAHMAAIKKYGITDEHRKSFEPIKSMVGFERPGKSVVKNTTLVGVRGEGAVCKFLESKGHTVLTRNFKTKVAEIDIVSVCGDKLYFTEVKYRKSSAHGTPLTAITNTKQKKMRMGAEIFAKTHQEYKSLDMVLAAAAVTGEDFVVDDWFVI